MWLDEVRESVSVSGGGGDVKNKCKMSWKDSIVNDKWTLLRGSASEMYEKVWRNHGIVNQLLFYLRLFRFDINGQESRWYEMK